MVGLGGDEIFPVAAELVCIGMEIEEAEVKVSALHTDNVLALWSRIWVRKGIDSQNAVVEAGEVFSEGGSVQVIDSKLDSLYYHLYSLYFQLIIGSRFTGFNVGTGRGSSKPAKEFESKENLKEVVLDADLLKVSVRVKYYRSVDDLMDEIDHLFVHSAAEANVQS